MEWKSKSLFNYTGLSLCGMVLVTALGMSQMSSYSGTAFSDCADHLLLDQTLPLSHPANRCASQKNQGVSWSSWFSGSSSSYPFHFIDLLELLSRSTDKSATTQPNNE
jgi:hypothetical protein